MANENKKEYSKFRTKVLRILLFIGIIPLLIISIISLVTVTKTRLENISELQSQVIGGANEKIKRFLDQKISVFNLVIDLDVNNISDPEVETSTLQFIAENLKEAAGDIYEISFIDKNGREVVKVSEVQGIEPIPLKDVSDREDFKTAISGENYFGPVDYTLSGPIMHIASQIENKNLRIIGVISAEVNLEPIGREISQIRIGKEGFVYLVDSRGNLIFSSNKDFARPGENLSYIPVVKDVINGKTHTGLSKEDKYINSLGQRVIFSGSSLETVKWSVISEWPWKDAFSVVGIMIERFSLILLASLILIVIFSLFFARLVVKPVETLSTGADEISKGNFDYEINIKTGDELEKLGERFSKMISVLKENERLRDEFVFIAAHELRAPVSVIKGYLSMILNDEFGTINEKQKKALGTMNILNERLVKLVQDLLEVARSEAGKMEIEVKQTSIGECVREVLEEFENSAKGKGISLIYKALSKEIKVMADPYRLKEVITNLVDNAIRYTISKGDVEISHEIKEDRLITHVKDQGIGISEEDIKKLFTKFYRVRRKETQEIEGTGLGLFICKEIVERMGGKIWAESQFGKGSIFSFSLDLAQ